MGFDDELPDRLRDGVDGLQPDVSRLVSGGVTRGKRMVRRRRIVQVVAAGATVVVLSGVAYAAPWNGGAGGNQNGGLQVAAPPTTTPSPKPPAKPKLADVTPQATLQLLLDQLPKDVKTGDYSGWSNANEMRPVTTTTSASLTYTDSAGAKTLMSIQLNWDPDAVRFNNTNVTPCPEPFGAGDWYICDYQELTDGGKLRLDQNWEYPASENTNDGKAGPNGRGAKIRSAALRRADGLEIYVWENNSSAEKDAPDSRPTPPLPLDQLKQIVSSPTWQTQLDADYVERAEKLFEPSE